MSDKYDALKLEKQLCFPLYVCSKEIVKKYKPYLDPLDLTYTQYITMLALWEHKKISVKQLGEFLYLDSGTLTPLLKKLEQKKLIIRGRDKGDERIVIVELTKKGKELRKEALKIPSKIGKCFSLSPDEEKALYKALYKILEKL